QIFPPERRGSMNIVTAAIVRKAGRVLLTRRAEKRRHAGFWEFPGGKLEDCETLQECLERELFEELGVRSTAGKVVYTSRFEYENGSIELIALEAHLDSFEFVLVDHDR